MHLCSMHMFVFIYVKLRFNLLILTTIPVKCVLRAHGHVYFYMAAQVSMQGMVSGAIRPDRKKLSLPPGPPNVVPVMSCFLVRAPILESK